MPYFGRINQAGVGEFIPDGSIENKELVNSSITLSGIGISLGDSIAQPAFDLTLATNLKSAALDNNTVNFGGVTLGLGSTDATPAFDLTNAVNYPTTSLTGVITNAQLAGSISNDKLVNSSVSFGGVQLSLGGSDATPAFVLSNATDYSANALTGPTLNSAVTASSLTSVGTLTSLEVAGNITGSVLISDVANGTAPIQVSSATTVTNLNADLLDGNQGTHFLDYNNFTNTPTIPTNNNELTNGAGYITSSGTVACATNADCLDGNQGTHFLDYNNFTNTPTIPTNNNELTNGAGYITSSGTAALAQGLTGTPNITVGTVTASRFLGATCNNLIAGTGSGDCLTTGCDNNFFGLCAGKCNTTGAFNNYLGKYAGHGGPVGGCAEYNNFFGLCAGYCITSGRYNNFFGYHVGKCNTCGEENVFIGHCVGYANTSASYNVFLGSFTGTCNTIGFRNNFIGRLAGYQNTEGSDNNFIGYGAGQGNTTGGCNVYLGRYAGFRSTTGSNNIFMGRYAGACIGLFGRNMEQTIIMGDCAGFSAGKVDCGNSNRNVWIGSYVATYNQCAGGSTSETYVGNFAGAYTQGSFNTFIGTYSGSNCSNCYVQNNVSIGRESGYSIKGSCNVAIGYVAEGGCFNNITIGYRAGANSFEGLAAVEATSNQIVIGNCHITNFYTKMRSAASAGTNVEWCSTTCELIADTSSCRFKHNIRPFLKGIEVINNIEPVRYKSNDDPEGPDHVGFIAEQIDEIGLTEFVSYDADDTPYSVSYGKMVSLLTNGIKELSAENQELRTRIIALENEVGIST